MQAIRKGFNSGEPTATGRITLVQETGNQFGVLISNLQDVNGKFCSAHLSFILTLKNHGRHG